MNYLKSLIALSLISLISGCNHVEPKTLTFIIDISQSNLRDISATKAKVSEIYKESGPEDKVSVYYFSSVKYLAYTGKKLPKDRDFDAILNSGLESALSNKTKAGTSFDLCRDIIEKSKDSEIYLFTDGYFEDSEITKIKLPQDSKIKIVGLNIKNNEQILQCFDDTSKVEIDFKGK